VDEVGKVGEGCGFAVLGQEDDAEGDEFIAVGMLVKGDSGEGAWRTCCGRELECEIVDGFEKVECPLDFGVVCADDGGGKLT